MRQVIPLKQAFFNDGYWYFLSSSSLGKTPLSPEQIEGRLQSEQPEAIQELLDRGVCLPLYFDGDCALDKAVVILGELSPAEEAQWIGRLSSWLHMPCGEFMLMGGGLAESIAEASRHFEPPDPHFSYFQKFKVPPGDYQIDVYAFIGSLTVNEHWRELQQDEDLRAWWQRSYPQTEAADWIQELEQHDYVDEDLKLLEYIIQLRPLKEKPQRPQQEADTQWCGVFEIRKPALCPPGIPLSKYHEARE